MHVVQLPGPFGVEVREFDFDELDQANIRDLLNLLYKNRFVVLKSADISKAEYVRFARCLGNPIRLSGDIEHPEIAEISNRRVNTKQKRLGAAHWHTDQSFRSVVSSITMLHSVNAPEQGGETKFCDMAAAYDALDVNLKTQIDSLVAMHRHGVSIVARPDDHVPIPPKNWDPRINAFHPIVRQHPVTKQKTLYAITGTVQGIVGMSNQEAVVLLEKLCRHTFRKPFITLYKHEKNDIVLWDNPTTMHSATPIEEATNTSNTRLLRRISLKGAPAIFADCYDEKLLDQNQFAEYFPEPA